MNAIKNKIKSRKGASITFALLIFMVCAIISTVVIVAASTASGRMSQIAQSDQMYYAVTSAAGLLRDDIDGTTVTVSYEVDNVENTINADEVVPNGAGAKTAIIADATCQFVQNLADVTPKARTFALRATDTALGCEIQENVKKDGRLIFEICYPSVSASKYTLQIIFNANISQSSSQITDASGTVKNKVTAVVEWKFSGVRKGALTESA